MKREDQLPAPVPAPEASRDEQRVMFDCLRHAITDTQNMLRAYDTKAQVLIALMTFSVGSVGRIIDEGELGAQLVVFATAAVVLSVCLAALVLYPRVPHVDQKMQERHPAETYYLSSELLRMPLDPLIDRVRGTNWLAELVYELRTLGRIRQAKAFWFRWAFMATGATVVGLYAVVFLNKL
jgi:hypothetical protein